MHRRLFLKAASAPFISRFGRAAAAERRFDPSFGTAGEALRAMAAGAISSRELTEHVVARIRKFNPKINAFLLLLEEQALERARQADEARAAGKARGPLHGLPVLTKDSFATAGIRTTSGSKMLAKHVPKEDAVAVARLRGAGAILVGKTNLPEFASDLQSYNEIAGTTNNPWDASRTPGGSTGGGAAALAAGFGFLELGSDIGGSIRTPCHFCGVYGHKPTLNVVPVDGHIPPPPATIAPLPDLAVAGPMARSAEDLLLELRVIGGPVRAEAAAWRWNLRPPRRARLRDYRIGFVLDDPFCPVASDVKRVMAGALDALRKAGVALAEGWPRGFDPQAAWESYSRLLAAVVGPGMEPSQIQKIREGAGSAWGHYAKGWIDGMTFSHQEWLRHTEARLKARAVWQEHFRTHDAFLMPVNIVPAFPHDHKLTFFERTVATADGPRLYADMLRWISPATFSGCPATVAPIGRTATGLPVGIQIVGPYLEDATPIDVAARLADVTGGFQAPAGLSG
ncbi:MAG: amidase [Acidobacteriota bacterium]